MDSLFYSTGYAVWTLIVLFAFFWFAGNALAYMDRISNRIERLRAASFGQKKALLKSLRSSRTHSLWSFREFVRFTIFGA